MVQEANSIHCCTGLNVLQGRKQFRKPREHMTRILNFETGRSEPGPSSAASSLERARRVATINAAREVQLAAGRRIAAAKRAARGFVSEDEPAYEPADYEASEPEDFGRSTSAPAGFYNRQLNPLLWVSDDRREAHFLTSDLPGPRCSKWQYTYVGLRLLEFTDGLELVGWCSDRNCVSCQPITAVAEGTRRLPHKRSWLECQMCERVKKMAVGVGSQTGLAYLLEDPRPGSSKPDGDFCRQLDLGQRKHVLAVKAGEGIESWAIVEKGRCSSCTSKPCKHTEQRKAPLARLTAAEFERLLRAKFDFTTGERIMRGISRGKLEEVVENSPDHLHIYNGTSSSCTSRLQHA